MTNQIQYPQPYYRYYDTPDGQDFGKKTYYLWRGIMPFSCWYAAHDVLMETKPKGWVPFADRFFRCFSRPFIASLLFESTVFITTNLRGKDDGLNHVFGAIPCFYFWSTFFPRPQIVWLLFLPTAISLWTFKELKVRYNFIFWPDHFAYGEDIDGGTLVDYFIFHWKKETLPKKYLTVDQAIEKGVITSREDGVQKGFIF